MDLKRKFGEIIRASRDNLNISQEKLALESNLDRTYISKLERGIHQPTLETLFAIASVLDCKPSDLIIKLERANIKN